MNTKSLLTRIGVPVLALGLLGGLGATLATSASAATLPGTVTANTHLNNHPDTTGIYNTGAIGTDNVWAHDNATEKFTVVPTGVNTSGVNTWRVTMDYVGSFHGFADPRVPSDTPPGDGLGAALVSDGSVKGTIAYDVASNNTPDPSLLPGQSASDAHIGDNIKTLFGDQQAVVTYVPNSSIFTYHKVAGADYTQVG